MSRRARRRTDWLGAQEMNRQHVHNPPPVSYAHTSSIQARSHTHASSIHPSHCPGTQREKNRATPEFSFLLYKGWPHRTLHSWARNATTVHRTVAVSLLPLRKGKQNQEQAGNLSFARVRRFHSRKDCTSPLRSRV